MKEPAILFSHWVRWDDRTTLQGIGHPGVYLIARFPEGPPPGGDADPRDPGIVHIGQTHDQTLRKRWNQFNRSAFRGSPGHSGGVMYSQLYANEPADVCVSAFPVELPEPYGLHFIAYVERLVIWEYVKANHARPACNSE